MPCRVSPPLKYNMLLRWVHALQRLGHRADREQLPVGIQRIELAVVRRERGGVIRRPIGCARLHCPPQSRSLAAVVLLRRRKQLVLIRREVLIQVSESARLIIATRSAGCIFLLM